jgi:hypothetical protein
MSDYFNDAKRKPWTSDPEIIKKLWGENAEATTKAATASDNLVRKGGSLWPTEQELTALSAKAMPEPQTFNSEPIVATNGIAKPMHSTSILRPIDNTQSLVDSVMGVHKSVKASQPIDPSARVPLFMNQEDVNSAEAQDDRSFGPDDGRNNIEGYDIDEQYDTEDDDSLVSNTKERVSKTKRTKLADSDFVLPAERKFPVTTAKRVKQAANSWGRYKGATGYDTFKQNLTTLAKRKGFESALPDDWRKEMIARKEFSQMEIIIDIANTPAGKRLKEVSHRMNEIINRKG